MSQIRQPFPDTRSVCSELGSDLIEHRVIARSSGLPLQAIYLSLQTLNEGPLLPWIAPALRGLVLRPLRDHFCAQQGGREVARESGLADWRTQKPPDPQANDYCVGCVKNSACPYGRVFEPDLNVIDASLIQRGDTQGVRGISIATTMLANLAGIQPSGVLPRYPVGVQPSSQGIWMPTGSQLTARLLGIGGSSIDVLPMVVEAIDAFGNSKGLGYRSPVMFAVNYSEMKSFDWALSLESLSLRTDSGTLPEVTIELESPLLLKSCVERGQLVPPTFRDLFSHSVRVLVRAIREYADASFLVESSLRDFLDASYEIQAVWQSLSRFSQASISHRGMISSQDKKNEQTYRERPLRGWLGSITFRHVPSSYLPWLVWAGRIGIGSDRNRGAGLWRVKL